VRAGTSAADANVSVTTNGEFVKTYPSIGRAIRLDVPLYVFAKYDGSNIRAEWSPREGFTRFGTRKRLLEPDHPVLGEAIDLIHARYAEPLHEALSARGAPGATCYFEFYGPRSFAGNHEEEDHAVTLFDVDIARRGLLRPEEFLDWFRDLPTAEVLHHGPLDEGFVESVRASALPGMPEEGVVCKGDLPPRRPGKAGKPVQFKIKTRAWLAGLRARCDGDESLFNRLR